MHVRGKEMSAKVQGCKDGDPQEIVLMQTDKPFIVPNITLNQSNRLQNAEERMQRCSYLDWLQFTRKRPKKLILNR